MKEEKTKYEPLEQPDLEDVKQIGLDTEEFENPDKAKALIKNLNLNVNDTLQEKKDYFYVNPRYVLVGHSPEEYKKTISRIKQILTKQEIKAISEAMKDGTKDYNEKLYNKIDKRTDKFYYNCNIRKSLNPEIREILEFFQQDNHMGLSNTIYHLLSKDDDSFLICYRCAWFDKPIPDQREWNLKYDGEYRVMTDIEADYTAREYLEDDGEMWKQSVEAGNTTSGFSDWVDEVLNMDGRASILNGYDGSEEYEEIDGETYYIYRNN